MTQEELNSSLMDAAKEGNVSRVHDLINSGANIESRNADGCTSLMLSAAKGHAACVEALVAAGAKVGSKNKKGYPKGGYSAEDFARNNWHNDIAVYLQSLPAEPADGDGEESSIETVSEIAAVPNNSGTGKDAILPDELRGWNWGAFFFPPIWLFCHKRAVGTLLWCIFILIVDTLQNHGLDVAVLKGIVGLSVGCALGAVGNRMAWQYRRWDSPDHFRSVQRTWAVWGLLPSLVLLIIVAVLAYLTVVGHYMQS